MPSFIQSDEWYGTPDIRYNPYVNTFQNNYGDSVGLRYDENAIYFPMYVSTQYGNKFVYLVIPKEFIQNVFRYWKILDEKGY